MFDLPRIASGDAAQIFVLTPGKTALEATDEPVMGMVMLHCLVAGQLTIDYPSGEQETLDFVENNQFGFAQPVKATIVSGTFHFMVI